ncbi:MAG: hypothetical protein RR619_03140 [Raoultibacter sp.]
MAHCRMSCPEESRCDLRDEATRCPIWRRSTEKQSIVTEARENAAKIEVERKEIAEKRVALRSEIRNVIDEKEITNVYAESWMRELLDEWYAARVMQNAGRIEQ